MLKLYFFDKVYTLLWLILLTCIYSWPCLVQLVSVEGLWEQGLCASNFEGSWISKTWAKGVGNLNVSLSYEFWFNIVLDSACKTLFM
jgi:hypothetical protein